MGNGGPAAEEGLVCNLVGCQPAYPAAWWMPENEDPCTGALQITSGNSTGQVRVPPEPDLTPSSRRPSLAGRPQPAGGSDRPEIRCKTPSGHAEEQAVGNAATEVFISEPEVAETNGPA